MTTTAIPHRAHGVRSSWHLLAIASDLSASRAVPGPRHQSNLTNALLVGKTIAMPTGHVPTARPAHVLRQVGASLTYLASTAQGTVEPGERGGLDRRDAGPARRAVGVDTWWPRTTSPSGTPTSMTGSPGRPPARPKWQLVHVVRVDGGTASTCNARTCRPAPRVVTLLPV